LIAEAPTNIYDLMKSCWAEVNKLTKFLKFSRNLRIGHPFYKFMILFYILKKRERRWRRKRNTNFQTGDFWFFYLFLIFVSDAARVQKEREKATKRLKDVVKGYAGNSQDFNEIETE
jgi:hypothetical protein